MGFVLVTPFSFISFDECYIEVDMNVSYLFIFLSSNLVVGGHTIKYGEGGVRLSNLKSLHKLCNDHTN